MFCAPASRPKAGQYLRTYYGAEITDAAALM
jgi:hypothetical protein